MTTDIKIQEFSEEFEDDVNRLNTRARYDNLPAVLRGFSAPFLHFLAAVLTILVWRILLVNFVFAVLISYCLAITLFLLITYGILFSNLTHYGQVGDVSRMDGGMLWVALDESGQGTPRVVGMVGIIPKSARLAEIARYMVEEEYRGRGIGRELLSTAMKFAKRTGYEEVEVETWNTGVVPASPIYERRGFRLHHTSYAPNAYLPMYRAIHLIKKLK